MEYCLQFIVQHESVDDVLSLIELALKLIDELSFIVLSLGTPHTPDEAIEELNRRFLEHGIGYQYQGGQIIAVNSQYLHSEVVEPAISLLHDANFSGALEEFMAAHEHYRKGDYKEAIANAGNAFESVMKTICDKHGWAYDRSPRVGADRGAVQQRFHPARDEKPLHRAAFRTSRRRSTFA